MFSGESFGLEVLGWMTTVFIFIVGLFILFLIAVYISDVTQTKQAIRKNYPVVGHFRYYFKHMDKEEIHFDRSRWQIYTRTPRQKADFLINNAELLTN